MANNIFQSWILHHLWISLLCSRQALSLNEIIKLKFLFVKGLISTFVDNNSVRCLCCRICGKVLVLWKNTPSTIARSQIDIFHTQVDWSFLPPTLQNYLQLQCFPVHISYFWQSYTFFWATDLIKKAKFCFTSLRPRVMTVILQIDLMQIFSVIIKIYLPLMKEQ